MSAEQHEARLVEADGPVRLRETWMLFQYATVGEFCDPIERLTGRTVRAFVSGTDTARGGVSVETFFLHPAGNNGRSRGDGASADGSGHA